MNETRMARRRGDLRDVRRAVRADDRPDVESDGPLDLDGRPDEPLRSALLFTLGRCPSCGYVGPADGLCAPEAKAPRAALAGLLESKAYRRLSADSKLPIATRTYLCRSWIDDVLGDPVRALKGALFAAWACDDHGLDAAAGELRARAIAYWDEAYEAGTPAYAECAPGVSEAVRAEMLRRIGRFAESVEQAVAALALPGVEGGVEHAISYIADRAARGDRESRDLADAFEEPTDELDPRLVSHEQGIEYRRTLIAGAIRGLLPRERPPGNPEDADRVRWRRLLRADPRAPRDAAGLCRGRRPRRSGHGVAVRLRSRAARSPGLDARRRRRCDCQLPPRVRGRGRRRARRGRWPASSSTPCDWSTAPATPAGSA